MTERRPIASLPVNATETATIWRDGTVIREDRFHRVTVRQTEPVREPTPREVLKETVDL